MRRRAEVLDVVSRLRGRSVAARLAALEAEVQEQRQLNRRVAELTDLVAELLVPLAGQDDGTVRGIVDRYRSSI
jgi:hypothetical protein